MARVLLVFVDGETIVGVDRYSTSTTVTGDYLRGFIDGHVRVLVSCSGVGVPR